MNKTEEYGFKTEKGGYTVFEGVMCNGKEIEKITVDKSSDRRTAECLFSDGCVYAVAADHSKNGNIETLENISAEWRCSGS